MYIPAEGLFFGHVHTGGNRPRATEQKLDTDGKNTYYAKARRSPHGRLTLANKTSDCHGCISAKTKLVGLQRTTIPNEESRLDVTVRTSDDTTAHSSSFLGDLLDAGRGRQTTPVSINENEVLLAGAPCSATWPANALLWSRCLAKKRQGPEPPKSRECCSLKARVNTCPTLPSRLMEHSIPTLKISQN